MRAARAAGAAYIDENLYNGRYYFQDIDLSDRSVLARFDTGRNAGVLSDDFIATYWSAEHGEIKYQFGEGCITDQILGQWHAEIAGVGGFLDPAKVRSALGAVFAENFRATMEDHFNPCRNFALEGEGGLLIATYPDGARQPIVAAPYAEEAWTGIEYASASHMIMHGLVDEGLAVVRTVRDRYDGANRNPYSEIECGSYYARSMSAWQLVNAWAGFGADFVAGTLSFSPREQRDYRLFWAAGKGWGELVRAGDRLALSVLGGELPAMTVTVAGTTYRTRAASGRGRGASRDRLTHPSAAAAEEEGHAGEGEEQSGDQPRVVERDPGQGQAGLDQRIEEHAGAGEEGEQAECLHTAHPLTLTEALPGTVQHWPAFLTARNEPSANPRRICADRLRRRRAACRPCAVPRAVAAAFG